MNWVDYVILATIGISVIVGLVRGFTREALSLVGWVAALWVTINFSEELQQLLVPHIQVAALRVGVAVVLLFVATLLIAALVTHLAHEFIAKSGLSGVDRTIGLAFGFARGCALVVLVVLLAGLTEVPKESGWRQSRLMHYFQSSAVWLRQFLPSEVAASIRY